MYSEKDRQISLWGDPLYERIVPDDHFLKKLAQLVDFKKVNEMVRGLYSKKMGRPSWEPALLFKVTLLQFMYDISDRRVEEEVRYNMAYKWFVGLNAEDIPPDHSTLSVFRDRLGTERFKKIFNWIVEEARVKGFVSDRLQVVDSTAIAAKVDIIKFGNCNSKDNDDNDEGTSPHPDKDARWGYKKKDKPFYGYKFHAGMDADGEIITKCKITSGNRHDSREFVSVLDGRTKRVAGDKGYDAWYIRYMLNLFGIRDSIYKRRRKNKTVKERSWIERKFSECKGVHRLSRARYWGLEKMSRQGFMTAIAVNLKQMVKLAMAPPRFAYVVSRR